MQNLSGNLPRELPNSLLDTGNRQVPSDTGLGNKETNRLTGDKNTLSVDNALLTGQQSADGTNIKKEIQVTSKLIYSKDSVDIS